jgi:anti-sigma-K factor RskA
LNVIGAPDVRLASMTGDGAAAGALAHAYWSRSRGLVFQAVGMPRLDPTRAYQLWLVPSGGAPVSVGLLQVSADGSSSHSTPLADVPAATAVAVTIEPAGGSQTPTMPIVMVGNLS